MKTPFGTWAALGATGISIVKSEVDMVQAQSSEEMRKEIDQLTQDAGNVLTFVGLSKLLGPMEKGVNKIVEINKQLLSPH